MPVLLLSLLLWTCTAIPACAAAPGVRDSLPATATYPAISSDRWNEITGAPEFGYKNELETEIGRNIQPESNNMLVRLIRNIAAFLLSPAGQVTIWLCLLSVVALVVYNTVIKRRHLLFHRKDLEAEHTGGDAISTETLLSANWHHKYEEARIAGDLRLATRYLFMELLQYMHHKGLIAYHPGHTNYEYYRELKNEALKKAFRSVLISYEYAWYGRFEVNDATLTATAQQVNAIKEMNENP